jgi:hypothetical protein
MTGKRLRRVRASCAAALALILAAGQNAYAWLETGTLLTNSASATYKAGDQATSVSYSATAKILVSNPKVFLFKDVNPTYVSAAGGGGLVTFTLCFSDVLPKNRYWMSTGCIDTYYDAWQVDGPEPAISYTEDNWNTPVEGCPPPNWPDPPGTDIGDEIRWVIDVLDIGESGCIWYVVRIGD